MNSHPRRGGRRARRRRRPRRARGGGKRGPAGRVARTPHARPVPPPPPCARTIRGEPARRRLAAVRTDIVGVRIVLRLARARPYGEAGGRMHRRGDEPALPDDEEAVRRKREVEERHVCVRARVWRPGGTMRYGIKFKKKMRYGIGIT